MRLRAYGDKILCKLIMTPLKSRSGLFLPKQKPTQQAVVCSIGTDFGLDLKPDDKIIVEVHGGIPLSHNGEDYVLYTKNEVMGKIEKED